MLGGDPRRRPRPDRGLPRARQDPRRALASPRPSASTSSARSSRPTCCPADLTGSFIFDQRAASSSSGAARCSPGCCSPTRSTARRPRPRRRCSRRCRSGRSPSRARPSRSPPPFHVLATANPVEYEGTYPLPEAQLDRFLMRVAFGYPTLDEEWDVLRGGSPGSRRSRRSTPSPTPPALLAMQAAVETVTRRRQRRPLLRGARDRRPASHSTCSSAPRRAGRSALLLAARAYAVIDGRDYVTPEDVKAVAMPRAGPPHHRQARAVDEQRQRRDGRAATSHGHASRRRAAARGPRSRLGQRTGSAMSARGLRATARAPSGRRTAAPTRAAPSPAVVAVAALGRRPDLLVLVAPLAVAGGVGRWPAGRAER